MEDYIINDIIEIICDEEGYLIVKFRIEDDDLDGFREIETDEYIYWAEENFIDNNFIYDLSIDDGYDDVEVYTDIIFNFTSWKKYQHGEETVINFICDTYKTLDNLPILIYNKD
jgi:asparagine N-glycosylation enzyme membrane subunit Stt3